MPTSDNARLVYEFAEHANVIAKKPSRDSCSRNLQVLDLVFRGDTHLNFVCHRHDTGHPFCGVFGLGLLVEIANDPLSVTTPRIALTARSVLSSSGFHSRPDSTAVEYSVRLHRNSFGETVLSSLTIALTMEGTSEGEYLFGSPRMRIGYWCRSRYKDLGMLITRSRMSGVAIVRAVFFAVSCALWAAAVCADTTRSGVEEYAQALRTVPDVTQGRAIYRETCRVCHGIQGEGQSDERAPVPAIGGQHYRALVKWLSQFRHGRSTQHRMDVFSEAYALPSTQNVADVAAYLATLAPTTGGDVGTGLALSHGALVYLHDCEVCHGATGQGNSILPVPRLAGQRYSYLLRQMDVPAGARQRSSEKDEHFVLLRAIRVADREAMADYLSRLVRRAESGG